MDLITAQTHQAFTIAPLAISGDVRTVAGIAIWPAAALVALAILRPSQGERWLPFAWAAVAATFAGVISTLVAFAMYTSSGTTRSMTSLLPMTIAGLCAAGAILCGAATLALRWMGRRAPSQDGRSR